MLNFPDQVTAVRVRSGGSARLEKKGGAVTRDAA